jgi:hypothetical protein
MEWLLPWWWERYSACNTLPVVFVDLGMSIEKRRWCQERGCVLPLEGEVQEKLPSQEILLEWKKRYGESYIQARKAWFKKPLACKMSPFATNLWLDLDCEVMECIEPVFSFLQGDQEVSIAWDAKQEVYNSGVIVFRKKSPLIAEWADLARTQSDQYWGDDRILSAILERFPEKVSLLPDLYHWRLSEGLPMGAKIIHWCGEWGKLCLAQHGGLKRSLKFYN